MMFLQLDTHPRRKAIPHVTSSSDQLVSVIDNLVDAGDVHELEEDMPVFSESLGNVAKFFGESLPTKNGAFIKNATFMKNATFTAGALSFLSSNFLPNLNLPAPTYGTFNASENWSWVDLQPDDGAACYAQRRDALSSRIERFCELPANWDGDGGVAPSLAAGEAATEFLSSLHEDELPEECHAVGDGEIVFQWRRKASFIEVAFDGPTISWYARLGDQEAVHSTDVFSTDSPIDNRLREAIRHIS